MVPPDAPMGADVAPREAVRVLEGWRLGGPLPGGGCIAGGGWTPVERLVGALAVARRGDVIERALLSPPRAGWRASGVRLPGAMPAFMAPMLLGCAGCDARGEDPQADPPGGEWGEPAQGLGGQGDPGVGAEARGHPQRLKQ